jgi:uncharacterized protein
MRIGVVADTHVGDQLAELPPEVPELLRGCDLVLHAGDLCAPSVLRALREVAPVVAVRGNHDAGLPDLPRRVVVRAGGRRIGLTHGVRPQPVEVASTLGFVATRRLRWVAHCRAVARGFGAVDCVVFGHLHLPVATRQDGILFFSPGAVYQPELDPAFAWGGAERRAYRAARRRLPAAARRPTLGVLELGENGIVPRVLRLRRPLRGGGPVPPG